MQGRLLRRKRMGFPHFYGEILQLLPRREIDDVLVNACTSLK